jgi:hypothetical protein
MSWWADKSVAVAPAPVEADRYEVLMAEFRDVEKQLVALNLQMRRFRQEYGISTNAFLQITRCQTDSFQRRKEIEAEWKGFRDRIDKIFPRRNTLLYELAELKKERENK